MPVSMKRAKISRTWLTQALDPGLQARQFLRKWSPCYDERTSAVLELEGHYLGHDGPKLARGSGYTVSGGTVCVNPMRMSDGYEEAALYVQRVGKTSPGTMKVVVLGPKF